MKTYQERIARALGGGLTEVIGTDHGVGRGIVHANGVLFMIGASPALVGWLTGKLEKASMPMRPFTLCTKCDTPEMMPMAPTSQGLNGNSEPLFVPGTSGHALHVLTWLHNFTGRHEHV